MAVSTVALSVCDSLSEHSMMFEFSDFKLTRLATRLAQPNTKIRKSREGFGLSAKGRAERVLHCAHTKPLLLCFLYLTIVSNPSKYPLLSLVIFSFSEP